MSVLIILIGVVIATVLGVLIEQICYKIERS
jgi:hypothetical protein